MVSVCRRGIPWIDAMPFVVEDAYEYMKTEGARTFKSTAGSQPKVPDEVLEPALAALERDGYVVFERLVPEEVVRAVKEDVLPRLAAPFGRNNFEGFATQRLYAVIEKTLACNPLVEHPLVLGLLDRMLLPNYLLSQLQVINILPGEAQQPLHHDDAFYPIPRPRRPLGAATIWAIDPFTAENGATVVIPGSHLWGEKLPTPEDEARRVSVVMPPGSVVFFYGTLWHAGGQNRTDAPRLCVTAQYCEPWCRQQENFAFSVSREKAKACSEHIQRMLGYSIFSPFIGFVDGAHPKRLLR
jgi:hypothetical protein